MYACPNLFKKVWQVAAKFLDGNSRLGGNIGIVQGFQVSMGFGKNAKGICLSGEGAYIELVKLIADSLGIPPNP